MRWCPSWVRAYNPASVTAYDASQWSSLFMATAAAAAALTGLVFVAVSINLTRILRFRGLPERALETLVLLLNVLVVSIAGLLPGQGHTALGIELLAVALVFAGMVVATALRSTLPEHVPRARMSLRVGTLAAATVPFVIGGASVLAASGGGLYWIAAGTVGAIAAALLNAWVLLVEINR